VKLRVEVTAEDIAAGNSGDCESCPIALACCRAGLNGVLVSDDGIAWNGGFVDLPAGGLEFISDFDRGRVVLPFTFEIEVPDTAVSK
jgi:hypothetical protein